MTPDLFLRIEPQSALPIYRQIVDQIRLAIAGGRIAADDRLPGVRELATSLSINLQTVQKAYAELVRTGALEQRRGMGTYVAQHTARQRSTSARSALEQRVGQLVRDARAAGMKREDLTRFVNEMWAEEK